MYAGHLYDIFFGGKGPLEVSSGSRIGYSVYVNITAGRLGT